MAEYAAIIVVAAAVASTAVAAYGAYESHKTASEAADYQAKIASNQAKAAAYSASVRARQERQRTRLIVGRQETLYGASGVSTDVGTPLLVMSESARQGELDALNIEYGGKLARGSFEAESKLRAYEADALLRSGYIRAGSTLLSGAGQAAGLYSRRTPSGTGQSPLVVDMAGP